jgi:hypothetical protein
MQSRDAISDAALVAFIQTLPADRLTRVLTGLGVAPEKVDAVAHKADDRRCRVCSHGYVRCRALDAKSPDDHHEWTPDRNRAGIATEQPAGAAPEREA